MKYNKEKLFISFLTAGDPSLNATKKYIELLSEFSDFVEIGIPFSDPSADGEVIERANKRALDNGVTIAKIFDMLETVRLSKNRNCKLVFLTYANPIFSFGYENFAKRCSETGVLGVIVPDIPFEEKEELSEALNKYNLEFVPLIAPTSGNRIQKLVKASKLFNYLVSNFGTTGNSSPILELTNEQVKEIKKHSDAPVCIGFGVSSKGVADEYRRISDGIIVGSAIVSIIEKHGENAEEELKKFLKEIL